MKKTLSLLLSLLLAFSCGMCVFALEPSDPAAVTGLTAEWNGQILLEQVNQSGQLFVSPNFNSLNVNVALTYDDRAPEALSEWYGEGAGGGWWVWSEITGRTDTELTVTVYYSNESLHDTPPAQLPQTTFTAPANLIETLINVQRPLDTLQPNKKVTAAAAKLAYKAHVFTAEQSGLHLVQQFCEGSLYILDENYTYVAQINSYNSTGMLKGGHCITVLEAGKSYYIISTGFSEESYQLKVTDGLRETSSFGLESFLFWQARITYSGGGSDYTVPLSSFSFFEAIGIMGMNLLDALFLVVTLPFLWWVFL